MDIIIVVSFITTLKKLPIKLSDGWFLRWEKALDLTNAINDLGGKHLSTS